MKIIMSNLFKVVVGFLFLLALLLPYIWQEQPQEVVEVKKPEIIEAPKKVEVIEQPLHDVVLPDFRKIVDVKEKKKQFFSFIRPAVEQENAKILMLREQLISIVDKLSLEGSLTVQEEALITRLVKSYRVGKKHTYLYQTHKLLEKVDIIPVELVLVQAANESAWGTSRFARIGLNYFGIWCYRKGCGMVPNGRNEGANHEVEAFDSVDEAVRRYLFNINSNNAYMVFRTIRAQLRANDQELAPEILATGLLPYSQRGTDYVLELTQMIRHNHQYFVQADVKSKDNTEVVKTSEQTTEKTTEHAGLQATPVKTINEEVAQVDADKSSILEPAVGAETRTDKDAQKTIKIEAEVETKVKTETETETDLELPEGI